MAWRLSITGGEYIGGGYGLRVAGAVFGYGVKKT